MKPSSEEEIAAESITPINQSSVKDDEHWGGSDFYSIGDQALTWVDSVFCHFLWRQEGFGNSQKNASLIFMCGLWTEGIVYMCGENFSIQLSKIP